MGFSLLKAGLGFITGGPAGAVAGGLSGFLKPAKQPQSGGLQIGQIPPDSTVTTTSGYGLFGPKSSKTTTYYTPTQSKGGGTMDLSKAGGACPTGFRLNKSTYVTRGGGTSRWPSGLSVHPKGSTCVRRRKINAGNGRAATHAVHRLVAFYRLSNRVAKQLRKAASRAHIRGARRGQRALPRGAGTQIIDVD